MEDRPVAVLAAGGKTATAVLRGLSAAGVPARASNRADADLDTGEGLHRALDGCSAVWLAVPNLHPDEPAVVERVLDAAISAGVPRIVYHSVAWPYAPAMPHHLGKAAGEDLVRRSGLAFTILQPCAYTQNLVPAVLAGRIAVPYSLDVRFSFVDLDDVAEAAAQVLARPGHEGATYELGGPEPLSVNQFVRIASSVLSRPVTAQRMPLDDWLTGPGSLLPAAARERLRAMFAAYDATGFVAGARVLEWLLGRPPRSAADTLARAQAAADTTRSTSRNPS